MSGSLETLDSGFRPQRISYGAGNVGTTTDMRRQYPIVPAVYNAYSSEVASQNNSTAYKTRNEPLGGLGFPTNVVADVDDEMRSLERRLESFQHWPENLPVKPVDLAVAGFYYTGVGDRVRCYSCDLQLMRWERGDNPLQEHKKCRPTCGFLLETERETRHGQIHDVPSESPTSYYTPQSQRNIYESAARPGQVSIRAQPIGAVPEVSQHLQSLAQMNAEYSPANTVYQLNPYQSVNIQSGGGREPYILVRSEEDRPSMPQQESYHTTEQGQMTLPQTQIPSIYRPMPSNQGFRAYQAPSASSQSYRYLPYAAGQSSYQEMTSQGNTPGRVPTLRPQGGPGQGGTPQPSLGIQENPRSNAPQMPTFVHRLQSLAASTTVPTSHYSRDVENEPVRRPHVPNLRIPVLGPLSQQPRGPLVRSENVHHVTSPTDLESEHHRLTTFVDWPEKSSVRPWELSSAGFYYLGNKDSVKCYKCGVALRNWEPQDTPWEEHEKWSPRCPLVLEYLQSRAHVRPVEAEEPRDYREPQASHGSEMVYPMNTRFNAPQGGSDIGRRSPPSATIDESNAMNQNWSAGSENRATSAHGFLPTTSSASYGHPPQPFQVPMEGSRSRESPTERYNEPVNSAHPPVENKSNISLENMNKLIELGFTRKDIEAAYAKKLANSGTIFVTLDELLHALIENSERPEEHQGPTPTQGCNLTENRNENQPPYLGNEPRQLTTGNLSLPTTTERQILRRTQSAPSASTEDAQGDESLQQKLERMQEERLCKICMDAEVGIVFLPCGHLSCCPDCAMGMELCPMCRAPIRETIRTFLS